MPAGHNAARIIVGTEQNVIAAVSGHNGQIGETNAFSVITRALQPQPVATCRHLPYLHKPATIIMTV